MKYYRYACVVALLFCFRSTLAHVDCLTQGTTLAPNPLARLLDSDHPCHSVQLPDTVDFSKVVGKWYALAVLCPWVVQDRMPLCDAVKFDGNDTLLELNWRNLDLFEDPVYSSMADYKTTLNVLKPALWVDTKPDQGNAVYLLLNAIHPYYLVLAKCYHNPPAHLMDVFVLSRSKKYVKRDLDMLITEATQQGIDERMFRKYILLWSTCESYSHLE